MRAILPFLFATILISCGKRDEPLVINWENEKAVSVSINRSLVTNDATPEINVSGSNYHVLCTVSADIGSFKFTPAVPFERGQTYDIVLGTDKIHSFTIPVDSSARPPTILASFPSCDTVPENLLKMYVTFDQPMMEGRAYSFIHLVNKSTGDTIEGAFLDLNPELWSEDQTTLTLWLNPGRIKQDLIPNKELGAVLTRNSHYELLISAGWKSKSGQAMGSSYTRSFVTTTRDSEKPDVSTWNITTSDHDIIVEAGESLDWSLLNSVISVWKGEGRIKGDVNVEHCEKGFRFKPATSMSPGSYRIEIESRLEDLAGNNLNRLFETDVTKDNRATKNKSVHTIAFKVE